MRPIKSRSPSTPPSYASQLASKEFGSHLRGTLAILGNFSILFSAVLAPLAVLYDIPALSQRWYEDAQGNTERDSIACLVLSAVTLTLSLLANLLLILRFSNRLRPRLTTFSAFLWGIKTKIEIINLAIFGHRANGIWDEGIWCCVWSTVLSGLCSLLLVYDYFFVKTDPLNTLKTGKRFMLSVSLLVFVLGMESLMFYRLEGWSYFDSIYFSVVSMLTIGFGDLYPTTTTAKILLFPFLILTIALLAHQITEILGFFSQFLADRRQDWYWKYAAKIDDRLSEETKPSTLKEEINSLMKLWSKEEGLHQYFELVVSILSFLLFWFLGAVAFAYMEDWTYGNSLYFCKDKYAYSTPSVFTVGYGDYSPITAAGRSFFIVYALIAVPIIASVLLQTVANVVAFAKSKSYDADAISLKYGEQVILPHGEIVQAQTRAVASKHRGVPPKLDEVDAEAIKDASSAIDYTVEGELLKTILQLETHARSLIMQLLPINHEASVILQADYRQQIQALRNLLPESERLLVEMNRVMDRNYRKDNMIMNCVDQYRQTFAKILVLGAEVMKLEGNRKHILLRHSVAAESMSIDHDNH